ncbi:MAG: dTDP-4-dehydrorhamnose reductase [Winogradskyella sp.]|uniref:dTDP-4-dehydrorhamnose reductase n=1 Tax=Winogradskyella sp. TaxID=1883156 RepID=UPI0025FDBDD4|nr:dTDP-4-dehydrorhamnose reductase [Winogradskyella sp.]NRB59559.1 dTDP-4-dehydrorhamnose reductase [Winogradskyella sp.]
MKTVLVTGAKGQLGQCIQKQSKHLKENIFLFEDYDTLDLTKKDQVKKYFEQHKIDWCVNCAAYTAVDLAEDESNEAFSVNAEAVSILAEQCNKYGTRLIHISTDFVFDGVINEPYTEDALPIPLGVYGESKLKGEQNIIEILKPYFIVRTSWLYSEFGANFMKTMIRLAQERDSLSVVNDQVGTPTYAMDLADVICEIIRQNSEAYGLYHYSNEGSISWYDFAKQIFEYVQSNIILKPIPSSDFKTKAIRPKYSVLDKTKIKENFNVEIPFWKDSLKIALERINE